ncbi:MAG TPA: amidohydrolase family protein, partial [Casimicrobiaceae bacterium]|nr:amidohydrolase family protein [Casimicrobiaceae bacterium]
TPAQALKCATRNNAQFLKEKGAAGTLEPGKLADFVVLRRNPLDDIRVLQDPGNIIAIYKDGRKVDLVLPQEVKEIRGEKSMTFWNNVYDRASQAARARQQ